MGAVKLWRHQMTAAIPVAKVRWQLQLQLKITLKQHEQQQQRLSICPPNQITAKHTYEFGESGAVGEGSAFAIVNYLNKIAIKMHNYASFRNEMNLVLQLIALRHTYINKKIHTNVYLPSYDCADILLMSDLLPKSTPLSSSSDPSYPSTLSWIH